MRLLIDQISIQQGKLVSLEGLILLIIIFFGIWPGLIDVNHLTLLLVPMICLVLIRFSWFYCTSLSGEAV